MTDDTSPYGLFGSLRATEGNGAELAGLLLTAAAELEDAPGCRRYLVALDAADPDLVWVHEVWDSEQAHAASLELTAVQELISRARPIMAGMGERHELVPLGGLG